MSDRLGCIEIGVSYPCDPLWSLHELYLYQYLLYISCGKPTIHGITCRPNHMWSSCKYTGLKSYVDTFFKSHVNHIWSHVDGMWSPSSIMYEITCDIETNHIVTRLSIIYQIIMCELTSNHKLHDLISTVCHRWRDSVGTHLNMLVLSPFNCVEPCFQFCSFPHGGAFNSAGTHLVQIRRYFSRGGALIPPGITSNLFVARYKSKIK